MRDFYDSDAAPLDEAGGLNDSGLVAQDLVRMAVLGDNRANDCLYKTVYPILYRRIARRVKRREDVEDILQETCMRVFTKLPQLRSADRFFPWLFSVCDSQISGWYRQHRREGEDLPLSCLEGAEDREVCFVSQEARQSQDPERAVQLSELAASWDLAMSRLTGRQRSVLLLRQQDQLKFRDIARREGISISTAKSRYADAVRTMRMGMAEALGLNLAEFRMILTIA